MTYMNRKRGEQKKEEESTITLKAKIEIVTHAKANQLSSWTFNLSKSNLVLPLYFLEK
jgi:hypothetical protein